MSPLAWHFGTCLFNSKLHLDVETKMYVGMQFSCLNWHSWLEGYLNTIKYGRGEEGEKSSSYIVLCFEDEISSWYEPWRLKALSTTILFYSMTLIIDSMYITHGGEENQPLDWEFTQWGFFHKNIEWKSSKEWNGMVITK